jgi:hypothetical protein
VAQVVPAKVRNADPPQVIAPCLRVGVDDWLAVISEDAFGMSPVLPCEHLDRQVAQRDVDVLATLGVLGSDPASLAIKVELRPPQAGDVALPEPGRQREQHNVALVLRQFGQQRPGLLRRDPTHSSLRFGMHLHFRHLVDSLPLKARPAQGGSHQRRVTVRSCAAGLAHLALTQRGNLVARNVREHPALQELLQPSQLEQVLTVRALVSRFV